MKLVYIAGKYTGQFHDVRSYEEIEHNISAARQVASDMTQEKIGFFCPHTHTAHFETIVPGGTDPAFMYEMTMEMLERCDAIFMLDGWHLSKGAIKELERAQELGFPVFTRFDELQEWYFGK